MVWCNFEPHPEEPCGAWRLEGWRQRKCVLPSFETRPAGAPQDDDSEHRRPVQTEMPEQRGERLQPLAAIRVDIQSFVIEESRAVAQTAAAFAHVAFHDLRRGVALAAERVLHVTARIIKNVA